MEEDESLKFLKSYTIIVEDTVQDKQEVLIQVFFSYCSLYIIGQIGPQCHFDGWI